MCIDGAIPDARQAVSKSFIPATTVLAAALALAAAPAGADVKAGVDAWSTGNYAAAIREWQPLADRGDPDALFNLAQAYKLGRGEPLDLGKAEALYGQAAAKGHPQAADAYGLLLFQRGERVRALPYVEAAASRGDPRAQYILGIGHFNGDIVKRDWVRAYALASLAQQAGLPQATSALAQMDQHIPLADRQKSVALASQLATEAQANRQRLSTTVELDTQGSGPTMAPASPSAVAHATKATLPPAPAPAPVAKPQAKPASHKPAPIAAPRAAGPWRVQLGAFGVAGNAEALWNRIKGRTELAGHPRMLVPAGKLTKLQAAGFGSKAEADAACARLTAGGFGCIAARD